MLLAKGFGCKGLGLGLHLTSCSSSISSSNSHHVKLLCFLSTSLKSGGGVSGSARSAYTSNYTYTAAATTSNHRSLFPEPRVGYNWIAHMSTEKALHREISSCTSPLISSGEGHNGSSNQTPPKLSILSFLFSLMVGFVGAMYEAPSKVISFLKPQTSIIAKIEEDLDKGAETVEKVATIVEQAAILVKEAADVVAEDARKTEVFMEKAQSTIKKLEGVVDNINNADSQSNHINTSK